MLLCALTRRAGRAVEENQLDEGNDFFDIYPLTSFNEFK